MILHMLPLPDEFTKIGLTLKTSTLCTETGNKNMEAGNNSSEKSKSPLCYNFFTDECLNVVFQQTLTENNFRPVHFFTKPILK